VVIPARRDGVSTFLSQARPKRDWNFARQTRAFASQRERGRVESTGGPAVRRARAPQTPLAERDDYIWRDYFASSSSLGGAASGTSRPVVEPACSASPSSLGFSSSSLLLELVASSPVDSLVPFTDPSLFSFGEVELDRPELDGPGIGFGVDADSLQPANKTATPANVRPARYFFKFAEKHM